MMTETLPYVHLPPLDAAALAVVFLCWAGYALFADRFRRGSGNLMTIMHLYRVKWMERMLMREIRIGDSAILTAMNQSNALFASTSVAIVAGLITLLGAVDKLAALSTQLPFVVQASQLVWEVKVLMLLFVFVYAFFKFIWSLRQFNFGLQLVGAAPLYDDLQAGDRVSYPKMAGRIISLGVDTFNRGVRAYYFGLAMLSWFLHPVAFMVASVWVVLVLYRREFRSKTLATLIAGMHEEKAR